MNIEKYRAGFENSKSAPVYVFFMLSTLLHLTVLLYFVYTAKNLFTIHVSSTTSLHIGFLEKNYRPNVVIHHAQYATSTMKHTGSVPHNEDLSTTYNQVLALNAIQSIHQDKPTASPAKTGEKVNEATQAIEPPIMRPGTTKENAKIKQKVLNHINTELKKYIIYPVTARKRGWAGLVMIGFQFTDAGMIRNVHLSKSSGFPILDQSALSAFQQISHIHFIEAIPIKHLKMLQLPIEFRLVEG